MTTATCLPLIMDGFAGISVPEKGKALGSWVLGLGGWASGSGQGLRSRSWAFGMISLSIAGVSSDLQNKTPLSPRPNTHDPTTQAHDPRPTTFLSPRSQFLPTTIPILHGIEMRNEPQAARIPLLPSHSVDRGNPVRLGLPGVFGADPGGIDRPGLERLHPAVVARQISRGNGPRTRDRARLRLRRFRSAGHGLLPFRKTILQQPDALCPQRRFRGTPAAGRPHSERIRLCDRRAIALPR